MRKKAGKQEKGLIIISINQIDAGRVGITISDDGAGIDHEKVRSAALSQGVISDAESEKITDEDAVNLIFESGVSTSPIVTTVSGRGLGMAIVKEKAEKLGGSVNIKSAAGMGTEFNIILPVAIATFRGILIESGGQMFVVPTKNVEKMSKVHISEIKTVENKETITFNGNAVSLVKLEDILEIQSPVKPDADEYINVMIIPASGKYIAFTIDRVLNEDEMLLKNLGRQLQRVRNISGATVLASGRVVPIINTSDIVKSASRIRSISSAVASNAMLNGKSGDVKSILVVEDSITARSLYVNILEAVGYKVSAAVDGIDGFTKLINGDFDLVVTDVQMPKMNGFELTEKIRGDARYGNIPVVLVTGMESADDKKRGIDSGANAYIVKSSFDQNNLLEIIERFI
jgi:two-component system, chemotaxis family, sensor kinase CheA